MASTARRVSIRCTAVGSLERAAEPRLGSIPLDGPFATTPRYRRAAPSHDHRRCAKRACAALAALEAAGVEFRLRHARAALERLDAVAPAAAPSAELIDDDDDEADSVASGPSRVADLGAGSVRSVRTRRTSSPRTVPDVPEDPWPSPRLDPASRRFSAASFLLPNDPRAAA